MSLVNYYRFLFLCIKKLMYKNVRKFDLGGCAIVIPPIKDLASRKDVFTYDGSKALLEKILTRFLLEKDPLNAILECLLIDPMWEETEDCWREFMRKLKRRGLRRVRMFISDAYQEI